MDPVVFLEIDTFDPELPGPRTLWVSGAPVTPRSPAVLCEERLLDASWLDRRLFAGDVPFGPLGGTRGRMVLGNLDGRLDWLAEAWAAGRPARLTLGDAAAGQGTVPLFTGVVEQALIGRDEVTLLLSDPLAVLDDTPLAAAAGPLDRLWRDCLGEAVPAAEDDGPLPVAWPVALPAAPAAAARLHHLAAAAGAWVGCDAAGRCRLLPLAPPEQTAPALAIPPLLEPLPGGPDCHRVEVGWQGGDAVWSEPDLRRRNPLARRLRLDTGLTREDCAGALAERLGALFGRPRRRWRATLPLRPDLVPDLGMVVAAGRQRLLVTGLGISPVSRRLEVTLWG